MTCRLLYPGGSAECICRLLPQHGSTSPRVSRVVFRIDLFEASSDVHLRYGLSLRGATKVALCIEGSDNFVTSIAASIATGQSDYSQVGLAPTEPGSSSQRTGTIRSVREQIEKAAERYRK